MVGADMSGESSVLIVLEPACGAEIPTTCLECLTTGSRLAEALGGRALALSMGRDAAAAAEEVAHCGMDAVYAVDAQILDADHPELYLSAIVQACGILKPRAVLLGDTLTSVDLAPRIAFALDAGLVTDCAAIECVGGEILLIKPVYGGKVMAAYTPAAEPFVATLQSGSDQAAPRDDAACARVVTLEVELDPLGVRTEVLIRVAEQEEGPRLASAPVVVAGGGGVGGREGFEKLRELARVLRAAVGASRPACDLGWAPARAQVGQTGEKVAPPVYIAIGISGASQHVAGMSRSRTIVAINKDARAEIFKIADYGVVGSWEEVGPAFCEAVSELLG
jgi:electron transfer flavoprotein alpha subunit